MRLLDGVASESVGVDLVISPAMQDLNAIEADVSHPSLPDILGRKGFDVVLSMETIEHLEDYFTFVRNCAELLRENGVAIVSTPNRRLTYERYSNRSHMDPSHVQEFTPVSFRETLGFAFQRVELFYQSIPGFWAIPEASNSARSEPAERRDVAGLRDYVPPIVWRSVRRLRRPPRRAIEGASPQQFARDRVQIAREYGGSETDPFALIAVCSDPL
jgi:SAM-dependent methyltransferase